MGPTAAQMQNALSGLCVPLCTQEQCGCGDKKGNFNERSTRAERQISSHTPKSPEEIKADAKAAAKKRGLDTIKKRAAAAQKS